MLKEDRINLLIDESNELNLDLFEYSNNGVSEEDIVHIEEAVVALKRLEEIDIKLDLLGA